MFSFIFLCAILVDFDGDSFERKVHDGRAIDETGHCDIVELHHCEFGLVMDLTQRRYLVDVWTFTQIQCSNQRLCFVWWFSLLMTFAAICYTRFSPKFQAEKRNLNENSH